MSARISLFTAVREVFMKYQRYKELTEQAFSIMNEEENLDRVCNFLNSYVAKNPNSPEGYLVRGECFTLMGRFQDALSDFGKAIEIDRSDAMAYFLRGNVYHKIEGCDKEALSDYNRAIGLDAKHAGAYCSRSSIYLRLGKYQEAISDCTKAIRLEAIDDEVSIVPYNNRALAYVHNFNFADVNEDECKKAVEDFSKVIGLEPEFANAYVWRGFVYLALNKPRETVKDYEKYLELAPDGEFAEALLGDIKDLKRGI